MPHIASLILPTVLCSPNSLYQVSFIWNTWKVSVLLNEPGPYSNHMAEILEHFLTMSIKPLLFIYSSVEEYLNCFHFLAIIKNGSIKIHVQLWFCKHSWHVFIFLWYIPQSEITKSYGNYMFNHLSNFQTISQGTCTILIPTTSEWRVQFFHFLVNTYYL